MTAEPLEIHMFPCLSDNYGFLIHDRRMRVTAAIDTPDANAYMRALDEKDWELTHILNTHHHADHAGGNLVLKERTGCQIVGPKADAQRIPGIDLAVAEGDELSFGSHPIRVVETPGHTRGHIVYYLPEDSVAFVGDTLFVMGCGRLFEGTPDQMWRSLQKIMEWPDDTAIYCAHEYTYANCRFAVTVEPNNQELERRMREVKRSRSENRPTVPTTLRQEKATNPFLRPTSEDLQETIDMPGAAIVDVFARTRALKDAF